MFMTVLDRSDLQGCNMFVAVEAFLRTLLLAYTLLWCFRSIHVDVYKRPVTKAVMLSSALIIDLHCCREEMYDVNGIERGQDNISVSVHSAQRASSTFSDGYFVTR